MAKAYKKMNAAERLIINTLKEYKFIRENLKPSNEKTDVEIVLEQMAKDLGLI